MKKFLFSAIFLCAIALAGCGAQPPRGETGGDTWSPPAVSNETLPPMSEAPPKTDLSAPTMSKAARYLCAEADGLNVRAGAGTSFPSLGIVQKGTLLAFDGEENGWICTRFRGKTAYVCKKYTSAVSIEKGDEQTERVIGEGLRLLGTPYIYGAVRFHDGKGNRLAGFSETKFDCSSLMQYLFYRGADILLDVTTRTQILQGEKVERSEIRRGDLLFFTNASRKDKTGIERVGHVALYLGDNYILHTASDFAKIEQLSPLRKSYFLEARRM